MQYFGKWPGFVEPWLSTKTGGGGEGGGGGGGGRDSPKWRSDSNLMLHNRSNLSNPTGPLQLLLGNMSLMRAVCI